MALEDNGRSLGQLELELVRLEVEFEAKSSKLKFEVIEEFQGFIDGLDGQDINSQATIVAVFNFRNLIDSLDNQIRTIRNEVRDFVQSIRLEYQNI